MSFSKKDFLGVLESDELLALARLDLEKERLDDALVKLKQAVSQSPTGLDELYAELGRLYGRLGLRERAKTAFQEYLERVPDALHEKFQLGLTHFESGEREEAQTFWREILSQVPDYPPAIFYDALANAQVGDVQQAWRQCKELLGKIPTDNLYFGRAKELVQRIEADPKFRGGLSLVGESSAAH